jgi:hypothetical protein
MYTLRGLGSLPLCSGIVKPAGFVGPVECDDSQGPVTYTPVERNETSLSDPFGWFALDQGHPTGVMPPSASRPPATTFSEWLNQNALNVGLAVAAAALLIGLSKR